MTEDNKEAAKKYACPECKKPILLEDLEEVVDEVEDEVEDEVVDEVVDEVEKGIIIKQQAKPRVEHKYHNIVWGILDNSTKTLQQDIYAKRSSAQRQVETSLDAGQDVELKEIKVK